MFGKGYVIDFCISFFRKEQEEKAEKMYIAECLRMMTENTARAFGGNYIEVKLYDILNPKPVDKRTADEVIDDMKQKIERMK